MTFIKVLDLQPWVDAGVIDAKDGGPGSWSQAGLCAQTDPEAFYPEGGRSAVPAKRICQGCDVRPQCLTYALITGEEHGVWGGASANERRGMEVPEPPKTAKRPARSAPAPAASFYHLQARRQALAVRMMSAGVSAEVVAVETQLAADTVRRLWREHQAVDGGVVDGPDPAPEQLAA
ncbi:WhiB family transcriptional regulator [Micromonospora lupini]|uniref:WhiB family transcriptional regulator n=1 Tax=Micromonospora lupini TaxID=285679 RepID=UPI002255A039|nr:WhiB family transcriptional regulator [Micromonospora lupini]MCX5070842.1 WhiB family transcriptional regulator [Micromonospora lupini]